MLSSAVPCSQLLAVCLSSGPGILVGSRTEFQLGVLDNLCPLPWIAFWLEKGLLSTVPLCPFLVPWLLWEGQRARGSWTAPLAHFLRAWPSGRKDHSKGVQGSLRQCSNYASLSPSVIEWFVF